MRRARRVRLDKLVGSGIPDASGGEHGRHADSVGVCLRRRETEEGAHSVCGRKRGGAFHGHGNRGAGPCQIHDFIRAYGSFFRAESPDSIHSLRAEIPQAQRPYGSLNAWRGDMAYHHNRGVFRLYDDRAYSGTVEARRLVFRQ